ncbi:hypothetical protein RFI_38332, partial [Reticulomyxa filosa]
VGLNEFVQEGKKKCKLKMKRESRPHCNPSKKKTVSQCIRWSGKFPDNNLAMAYQLWRSKHDIESDSISMLLKLVFQGYTQWIELKFPIKGITIMIGSEIEAIRQALEKVQIQYKNEIVVILSDCKFAVNAIHIKCNSETYNFPIAECQRLMKELGDNGVPRFIGSKNILEMNEQMQWQIERDSKQSSINLNYLGGQINRLHF